MGATVGKDGRVELCLDRRLDQDDGRGLGEPVRDNVKMAINTWVTISKSNAENVPSINGLESSLVNYPPVLFVGFDKTDEKQTLQMYEFQCFWFGVKRKFIGLTVFQA